MENPTKIQETRNPSLIPSPQSYSSTNSSSSNGVHHHRRPSPPKPTPITRSEPNNPFPTTFVQADTNSFKQVVQMLTGSSDTTRLASSSRHDSISGSIPPIKTGPKKEKYASKLYERRKGLRNFKINPLASGLVNVNHGFLSGYSGSSRSGTPGILSPSILDSPSTLALSPVTPLIPDPFNRERAAGSCNSELDMDAEDKAIKEKGFYMHPSPANTPREPEPRLLPLFPLTSPRVKSSYNAAHS